MHIYVGNLSLMVTSEELRREFDIFGSVISVRMMNDRYIGSGQARTYGYIEMALKSEGDKAILTLNGKLLRGQPMLVIEALALSDNQTNFRYRQRNILHGEQ